MPFPSLLGRGGLVFLGFLGAPRRLPLAAGVGGGSSDAGAALRVLRGLWAPQLTDNQLQAIAEDLGADGAACLWGRAVIAEGRGERLSPAPALPPLPAVLVNPAVPSPTGAVYRAYDAMGGPGACDRPAAPEPIVRGDRGRMGQARIVDRPGHQRQAGAGDERQQSDAGCLGDTPLRPLA